MVNLKTYEHLKLITKSLVSGQEVVWKVLWSIVNHHGKLHYEKCVAEFKRATGHSLQDYFEFEDSEMRQFLYKK
jgi:hypothetical protein